MGDTWTVDIRDFQSLKTAHLTIEPGITTIVGKTNEGKSAVFRAIDAALFNMGDDSMIRGGQRYYGISIDNEDHKMVFMRDGKGKNEKSAYQFDGGTVQKKVGRGQLPEVAKLFNVRDVRMPNGTKLKINFWYQNDKPFLMDKTSGQLYEFLSLTSCDKYSKVLKTMQADSRVLRAEVTNVTTEIDTLKRINNRKRDFIDANQGFDDVYIRTVTLSQEFKKAESIERLLGELAVLKGRIGEVTQELQGVETSLSRLPLREWTDRYAKIVQGSQSVEGIRSDISQASAIKDSLARISQSLAKVSQKHSASEVVIDYMSGHLDKISGSWETLREVKGIFTECERIESRLSQVAKRQGEIQELSYGDIEDSRERLTRIVSMSEQVKELKGLFQAVDLLSGEIKTKDQKISQVGIQSEENARELEQLKLRAGYCPYCGTVFSSMSDNQIREHLGGM